MRLLLKPSRYPDEMTPLDLINRTRHQTVVVVERVVSVPGPDLPIFDPSENRFTWFDSQSLDDSRIVATTVEQFLDWWWDYSQELNPRNEIVDAACPPPCS